MPLPLLPIGIGALAIGAFVAKKRRAAALEMTPTVAAERRVIYEAALNSTMPPDKLRLLAKAFHEQGMNAECKMLILRAQLREATPEKKAERKAFFRQAMESKNVAAIRNVADAFDMIAASAAARDLRIHAQGVEDAAKLETTTAEQAPISVEEDGSA